MRDGLAGRLRLGNLCKRETEDTACHGLLVEENLIKEVQGPRWIDSSDLNAGAWDQATGPVVTCLLQRPAGLVRADGAVLPPFPHLFFLR